SASLPIYPLHRACLRPSWLTGPADQDQKQEHGGLKADLSVKSQLKSCRSWLAGDADNSVFQTPRGDAIAGKPAPTFEPPSTAA
ncbi:hypothetical protein QN410_34015, partial [Pseudomonas sp. Bout1]|nr:hypothetical protein [Pseudomonas sp. Bout1]